MLRSVRIGLTFFCICLLFLCCTIRSGIVVDKSFIPRFALLSFVLLITWIVSAGSTRKFSTGLLGLLLLLFYGWSMASAVWAIDPSEAVLQSQLVFLSLVVFFVISAFTWKYREFEKLFIRVHLLVLLFAYGLAFYKMSTLPYYDPYQVISVSANNNLFSGYLLLSLPLVFAGYIILRGFWKYLSVFAGILAFFLIIIVQTRAAYIGILISMGIAFILLASAYRSTFNKKNIFTGVLCIALLAALVTAFTFRLDDSRRQYFLSKIRVWDYFRSYEEIRAKNIEKLKQADLNDHTKITPFDFAENYYENANLRVIFWQKSFGLIGNHPLIGVGMGNWRLAIPAIKDPPNPEHTIGNYTYSEPHNEWIRIMAELGIPGIVLAVLIFFLPPGFVFFRILKASAKPPVEAVFYSAFLVGFYCYSAFDFPLRRMEHNILFWSVYAFLMIKAPLWEKGGISIPKILRSANYFIILLLLVFSVLISFFRFRGEYYTKLFFLNERKDDASVVVYCRKAENPFYNLTPNTLPVPWFEGVAQYRLGKNQVAGACFLRALKITPWEVRVLNDYAAALYRAGKPLEAIRTLRTTLLIDPFFDEARFNLGAIYFLTGQKANARQEILKCRESQKKHDFLAEMPG